MATMKQRKTAKKNLKKAGTAGKSSRARSTTSRGGKKVGARKATRRTSKK